MTCPAHPGVSWFGALAECFVCHPTPAVFTYDPADRFKLPEADHTEPPLLGFPGA